MVYSPVNGFTLSQRESYAPSGVKLPSPRHPDVNTRAAHWSRDTVQSAEAKHVIPTAAVATMVLPKKKKDCEGQHCRVRSWSRGHERPTVLPARDRIYQIHAHSHATLRRQA